MKLNSLVLSSLVASTAFMAQGAGAATVDRTAAVALASDGVGGYSAFFGDTFGASTYNDAFVDTFTFNVGTPIDASASLTSSYLDTPQTKDLLITGLSLYRYDPTTMQMIGTAIAGINQTGFGSNPTDSWSLAGYDLAPGYYALQVNGRVRGVAGGSFGADLTLSPVPEPETWGMLVAGLGVLTSLAWRRRQVARVRVERRPRRV